MKQTKITMNLDGLNDLVKGLGDTWVTRVGILGGKNAREGDFGNADIGCLHELGSLSNNIPPRSFLRMPLDLKKQDLMTAFAGAGARDAISKGDYKKAFQILGVKAEEIVQNAFASGGFGQWPQLKPATIKAKGSSAILIDTSELRRAQTSDVVKRSEI